MVTVATSLDAPIKILFPKSKYLFLNNSHGFALLGGGDIIVPGLWCGLCLRYDWYVLPFLSPSLTRRVVFVSDFAGVGPARRTHRRTQSGQKDNGEYRCSTNRSSQLRSLHMSSGSGRRSAQCSGSMQPSQRCCTSGTFNSLLLSLSPIRIYTPTYSDYCHLPFSAGWVYSPACLLATFLTAYFKGAWAAMWAWVDESVESTLEDEQGREKSEDVRTNGHSRGDGARTSSIKS